MKYILACNANYKIFYTIFQVTEMLKAQGHQNHDTTNQQHKSFIVGYYKKDFNLVFYSNFNQVYSTKGGELNINGKS